MYHVHIPKSRRSTQFLNALLYFRVFPYIHDATISHDNDAIKPVQLFSAMQDCHYRPILQVFKYDLMHLPVSLGINAVPLVSNKRGIEYEVKMQNSLASRLVK